jgi:nicotinamide-nucleotide amidase
MNLTATIITIGDELLIGQTIDTNSAYIGQKLGDIGIKIRRRIAIGDDKGEIVAVINEGFQLSNILIFTGGLGPTKDDITKKTIAQFLGLKLVRDEPTYQQVKDFFESRNRPFLDVNKAQADVPENCIVLKNERGTAPGMWFELDKKILISLPGVPFEMKFLIDKEVQPRLKAKFNLDPLYHYHIQTSGIGESFLAKKIEHIENELPENIKLAYLPSLGILKLRLSGQESRRLEIESFGTRIVEEIKPYYISSSDLPIEQLLLEKLKEIGSTFVTVESATSGFLADSFTNFSGSSDVYKGGWNVYSDEFKSKELGVRKDTLLKYSSVSEETLRELLDSARQKTNVDYAIGVVGYLEKNDVNASAFAFIGVRDKISTQILKIELFHQRIQAKEYIKNCLFSFFYTCLRKL